MTAESSPREPRAKSEVLRPDAPFVPPALPERPSSGPPATPSSPPQSVLASSGQTQVVRGRRDPPTHVQCLLPCRGKNSALHRDSWKTASPPLPPPLPQTRMTP